MSSLPRGVTQVLWKNKTKSKEKQVKFRVRVSKKVNGEPFKIDQLCDTLEEAKEELTILSSTDYLTKLNNRKEMDSLLKLNEEIYKICKDNFSLILLE